MPVANGTAYSMTVVYRYSWQDAHGTKLIDQYLFGMRSIGCSSRHLLLKLLLIYGSVFVSSSSSSSYSILFSSSVHLACTSTSLGAISLRFHPVSFHTAVCCQARGSYIVPGATLLGAVLISYTINKLSQPALATQATPVFRLCLRLPFFFFSLLLLSRAST